VKRATDVFALIIALAGFAVSYSTQITLAGNHGFGTWQSWLWPGIAEAAALTVVVRLHLGQVRRGIYTLEAWGIFIFASGVGVAANAIADGSDPLGGAMHAVVPFMVLAVAHVTIHGRPAEDTGADMAEDMTTDVSEVEDMEDMEGEASVPSPPKVPARVLVERLVRRHNGDVTPAMVVAKTGVSARHANRLLAEVRRLKVIAE
jgi:hypothetical protein